MSNASILIIGNEILSGRTLEKNSNFICSRCTNLGIKIKEIRIIADQKSQIIKNALYLSSKYKNVFVTGGIGPTHDDITAQSISDAFSRRLVLNKKAKILLSNFYKKKKVELNSSRLKMAMIPERAKLIFNSVSAAPGFKIKNVWVMAGVPKIMQSMFIKEVEPKLKKGNKIFTKNIKILSAEGDIANILNNLQKNYKHIEIGSYPFIINKRAATDIVFKGSNKEIIYKVIKIFKKKIEENNFKYI